MSLTPSISTGSTSSSNTNHRMQSNEQDDVDPSNRLYNDHQNYQIIFSNDSRFFDTSLHLYKSYRKLGYIQINSQNGKNNSRLKLNTTLRTSTNNISNTKSSGASHYNRNNHDNNTTLKPQMRISTDQRSVSNSSNNIRSSKLVSNISLSDDRPWPTRNNNENDHNNNNNHDDDDDDEADIIITRL